MKKIILTAVNDNDVFWFDQLIPFLLSLQNTDYDGDIGIISYHLSENKKQILKRQGYLIFEAADRYDTIYIDRQYTTAEIAQKYAYDYVALYDADIWFPAKQFTLFSELYDTEKLFCCYDVSYGDFIEGCVKQDYRSKIRESMQNYLKQHKNLWQVGLIAGYRKAWEQYQNYLVSMLNHSEIFTQDYGIDSLLMVLFSEENGGVIALSEKYNCLPICGNLKFSNITSSGEILKEEIFTICDEPVQGLHITGPFRLYGRNSYEYIYHNGKNYFSQGKQFQPENLVTKNVTFPPLTHQNKTAQLKIIKAITENTLIIQQNSDHFSIITGSNTQITLKNSSEKALYLKFAIQPVLGKRITKGRFIYHRNETPTIYHLGVWNTIELKPNEELILVSYDIDHEAQINWVLNDISLI